MWTLSRRKPVVTTLAAIAVLVLAGCSSGSGDDDPPGGTDTAIPDDSVGPQPVADMPRWEQRQSIDTPRDDFAHVVLGDEIWAFGGMTGARAERLTTTEIYDTGDDEWRYGPEVPQGLASFEGAVVDDTVYLFGGLNRQGRASRFAASLDPETETWQELPPLPHARYSHDVAEVAGKLYVVGGEGPRGLVSQVDVFDPRSRTWSQAGRMPDVRSHPDVVTAGDRMYVLGDWRDSEPSDIVQIFDPAGQTWQKAASLPNPMSRGGAAVHDGKIYVSYHDWSAVYDIAADEWSRANPLTVSRHGLGYATVGSRIYAIGGCTPSPLRDVGFVDVLDLEA